MASDLLTTDEAAVLRRCTAQTIRRALATGRLSGGKFGRRWLVHRCSLHLIPHVPRPADEAVRLQTALLLAG